MPSLTIGLSEAELKGTEPLFRYPFVFAFCLILVIGLLCAEFGDLHAQFFSSSTTRSIDTLRTVVRIDTSSQEEKRFQQHFTNRNQKPFTDALDGKDGLTWGHCGGTQMVYRPLSPYQLR